MRAGEPCSVARDGNDHVFPRELQLLDEPAADKTIRAEHCDFHDVIPARRWADSSSIAVSQGCGNKRRRV